MKSCFIFVSVSKQMSHSSLVQHRINLNDLNCNFEQVAAKWGVFSGRQDKNKKSKCFAKFEIFEIDTIRGQDNNLVFVIFRYIEPSSFNT